MKKKIIAVATTLIIIFVMFTGCSSGGEKTSESIVGSWEGGLNSGINSIYSVTFTPNGSFEMKVIAVSYSRFTGEGYYDPITRTGAYTISGSKLTFKYDQSDSYTGLEFTIEFKDGWLILTDVYGKVTELQKK
jgi:hypothetical protein